MKLQISLEFMLVFAFVITIFIVFFAVIATRGSLLANQQVFAQTQLIAQTVAQQLNAALGAGSGYSANVILQGNYGISTYSIQILQNGEVIVSAQQGQQTIQSIAYSQARTFITASSIGTNTMSIQNYLGAICVDVSCPEQGNVTSSVSLTAQTVHAARFNGVSSYISTGTNSLPTGSSPDSGFAWIYLTTTPGTGSYAFIYSHGSSSHGAAIFVNSADHLWFGDPDVASFSSSLTVPLNTWTFVGYSYSSGSVTLYLNGQSQSETFQTQNTGSTYSDIGLEGRDVLDYFTGSIANLQVYNTAFTQAQATALYGEGIGGSPIASANVVAWWPLNGNTYDYGGHNNTGTQHVVVFPAVSQLTAKVSSSYGKALSGALVGFSTTLGSFGKHQFAANYTNQNGIAYAFLNQNITSGMATVNVTSYIGGLGQQKNLSAWWPLTTGFMNRTPVYGIVDWWPLNGNAKDYVGLNSGTSYNVIYSKIPSQPNSAYSGNFNGVSSYIVANSPSGLAGTGSVCTWFYPSASQSSSAAYTIGDLGNSIDSNELDILSDAGYFQVLNSVGGTIYVLSDGTPLTLGTWYFGCVTWTGSNMYLYLNGNAASSNAHGTTDSADWSSPLYIGTRGSYLTSFQPWFGQISDFQIYNTPLTSLQVAQLYSEGVSGQPIAYTATNAYDISGYNNTGLTSNVVYSSSGAVFNGASSYISANAASLPSGSTARSAFAWIYYTGNMTTGWPHGQMISVYGTPSAEETSGLAIYNDQLYFVGYQDDFQSTLKVAPRAWYLVGYTYQAGSTQVTLYLDGQSQTGTLSGSAALNTFIGTSGSQYIGSWGTGSSWDFNGTVSNLQIYKSALTPTQVWQLYATGPPPAYNASVPLTLLH